MSQRSSGHHYRADSGRVVQTHAAANAASSAASHPAHHAQRPAAQPAPGSPGPSQGAPAVQPENRLHAGAFRPSGAGRAGHVLDRGGQPRDHGRLVARDRHLFRLPRRRADAADRAPEGAAVRLRGPHRRIAGAGRPHHQPAIAQPGAVRAEARADHAAPVGPGEPRDHAVLGARSDADRLDRPKPPRPARRTAIRRPGQSLADQRHGDLHRAARSRGASGIARTAAGRAQAPCRGFVQDPRPASRACWRGCRLRSTASRRGRPPRSTRWKSATTPRPSASAACWPISAWTARSSERRHRRPRSAAPSFRSPAQGRRRLRAPALPRARLARRRRPADAHARRRAGAKADHGRHRSVLGLRRAYRSVPRRGPRCTAGSTSAARPATRCAPPPTARSRPRAGTAATARWSRSTTATAISTRYGHLSEIDVKAGPAGQDRPDHRQGRLDRPLDRTAPALRDAHRRRRGRSAEIPARGPSARQRAVTRAAWRTSFQIKNRAANLPPEFLIPFEINLLCSVRHSTLHRPEAAFHPGWPESQQQPRSGKPRTQKRSKKERSTSEPSSIVYLRFSSIGRLKVHRPLDAGSRQRRP